MIRELLGTVALLAVAAGIARALLRPFERRTPRARRGA